MKVLKADRRPPSPYTKQHFVPVLVFHGHVPLQWAGQDRLAGRPQRQPYLPPFDAMGGSVTSFQASCGFHVRTVSPLRRSRQASSERLRLHLGFSLSDLEIRLAPRWSTGSTGMFRRSRNGSAHPGDGPTGRYLAPSPPAVGLQCGGSGAIILRGTLFP